MSRDSRVCASIVGASLPTVSTLLYFTLEVRNELILVFVVAICLLIPCILVALLLLPWGLCFSRSCYSCNLPIDRDASPDQFE